MKRNNGAIYYLAIALVCSLSSCAVGEPLPEDYYAGVDKIAGGKAPSVPVVTFTSATLRFDFSAAIDPESGGEVPTYYIYSYRGVPQVYYEPRHIDLSISPPDAKTFFFTNGTTGTYTVIVTGYDGARESAISDQNKITFNVP